MGHVLAETKNFDGVWTLHDQMKTVYMRLANRPEIEQAVLEAWRSVYFGGTTDHTINEEHYICSRTGCSTIEPALSQCARCKVQYYCSKECQSS